MDVDSLFKVPKLPAGTKRRLPEVPKPEMMKKVRIGADEDNRTEVLEEISVDATSDFAPGRDADYFAEEDSEGRFYGGGLTSEQKDILNIFESAGGEDILQDSEDISLSTIRRLLLRFDRAANKNQDQRSKYPNDPTRFIDSEADLDIAIKALLPLAQAPILAYPELIRSGIASMLIGLLSHENADIVIDVVEVIHELTDENVGNEEVEREENPEEALEILMGGLLEHSILELLVDNLPRLNEENESDRQGIFHILGIFENILSFDPRLSSRLVEKTTLLKWLLTRVQSKKHDENRSYAAELLSILLQDNRENRLHFGKCDGVEINLKTLSQYRRRDPVDADETEFMDNLFDTLCSALNEKENKSLFISSEGPELMVLLMKKQLQARSLSIKVLDYAMSGSGGSTICEKFVETLGLKPLFSSLMGKKKKSTSALASEETTHILGIVSSLFSNLASDSRLRIRLLTKFVESDFEKVDKLLEIRQNAQARLKVTEASITSQPKDYEDGVDQVKVQQYLQRLDGGLYTLQCADYILAWLMIEDDGVYAHIVQMLNRQNQSLRDIISTLRVFHENVDDVAEPSSDEGLSRKEILEELINALEPQRPGD